MMKKKTSITPEDNGFMDEVHRTERDIDAFLKEKSGEAHGILEEAVGRCELLMEEARQEAELKAGELRDRLWRETGKEAEKIVTEARGKARQEARKGEERIHKAAQLVVGLVLGDDLEDHR
jgi:vacuolar-type H+-ATPase subunit H